MAVGDSVSDADKVKSNMPVNFRGRKRQLKSNIGAAWGKLLSQRSQVSFFSHSKTFAFINLIANT